MKGLIRTKSFLVCPACGKGELAVDHIQVGKAFVRWSCEECGAYFSGAHTPEGWLVEIIKGAVGEKITVTLQSRTTPPITLKLHTWDYPSWDGRQLTPDEIWDNKQYYYNEHTCPTNFMPDVDEIIFNQESDPHGVFEFVSMEFGWSEEEQ